MGEKKQLQVKADAFDRRGFLHLAAGVGLATVTGVGAAEGSTPTAADESRQNAILIDTTWCAGCRGCELACAEAHGLPAPEADDEAAFSRVRKTSDTQLTLVNRFTTDDGEFFAKRQCMHCVQPACASACLTRAMLKTAEGPVVWRPSKCMGCRYCMVSCPFDVPKFEYHSANPRILKCDMCFERTRNGELPVCVETCPAEALKFGPRDELLSEARQRIVANPGQYFPHIYGEHEAGGTGVLYLTGVAPAEMGLPTNVGTDPYPESTREFLYGVPMVLTIVPALLLGLSQASRGKEERS